MLIRGETTEDRIAKIAQGFNQGAQNFITGQDKQKSQGLQAEATRRQQALQALEVESKIAEQTGKDVVGSGIGSQYLSNMPMDLGSVLKDKNYTQKALKDQAALERQGRLDGINEEVSRSTIKKNEASAQKAAAKASSPVLTKGDESADREYGKNYNNFTSKGVVNSASSIKRLEEIADELETDQGFGEASGTKIPFPDWVRSSDAIRRREGAKNAAFSTIKELLPGSVSDSDREAVTRDYYNDQLGAKENAAIIREKIIQLKAIRELEIQKAKHFGEKGTLKGFNLNESPLTDKKETSGPGPWAKYGGK
ncbi:MAG: hypothetical protein M3P98_03110 [bacterium]|nr:hypothetical protein [bacterium]